MTHGLLKFFAKDLLPGAALPQSCPHKSILIHQVANNQGMRQLAGRIALLSTFLLSGCAALVGDAAYSAAFRIKIEDIAKISSEELQQVRDVKLISFPSESPYVAKGKIVSLACKLSVAPLVPVWTWRPPLSDTNGRTPEEAALTQLKLTAVRAGGNAIFSHACVHGDSIDWSNNCFETWICRGEAARVAE
ncbi:MAG: hypothetical protein WCC58_01825 [Burkholderiales bacterium]